MHKKKRTTTEPYGPEKRKEKRARGKKESFFIIDISQVLCNNRTDDDNEFELILRMKIFFAALPFFSLSFRALPSLTHFYFIVSSILDDVVNLEILRFCATKNKGDRKLVQGG